MDFNFFQWIREGVRQSVLLGVSDAVDQLGTVPQHEELNQSLRAALGLEESSTATSGTTGTRRKRLGRSLKDS